MYEKIIKFYILKLLFSKFYQAYQVLKFLNFILEIYQVLYFKILIVKHV